MSYTSTTVSTIGWRFQRGHSLLKGPFVRVAPNVVSFNDPTLLPLVYHKHAEKTPFYSTGMAGEEAPLLQTEDDSEHAEKMRILGPTVGASFSN